MNRIVILSSGSRKFGLPLSPGKLGRSSRLTANSLYSLGDNDAGMAVQLIFRQ